MKRFAAMILAAALAGSLALAGCSGSAGGAGQTPETAAETQAEPVTMENVAHGVYAEQDYAVDYGVTELYELEEMDEAIGLIVAKIGEFPEGTELLSIRYAGDDCAAEENVAWMNELSEGPEYTEVIEFLTDFHTPAEDSGAFNPDEDYTDYQWWLARTEGGSWELMTWGY